MGWLIDKLRSDCDYSPDEDGSIDSLIAYKDALEDLVCVIDLAASKNATAQSSAADVCAVLFDHGLGNLTKAEIEEAGR